MSPYGVGGVHRHTPEIEQNLSRRSRRAGHRLVHPDPRADAARHPRDLHREARAPGADAEAVREAWRDGIRRRAVRPPAARGQWPTHGRGARQRTTCSSRSPSTSGSAGSSSSRAIDNLTKGTAGAAVQSMNLALGLPETRACRSQESRRERHNGRNAASGPPASPPGSRRAARPTWRSSSTTARPPRRRGVHQQPGRGRTGDLVAPGASPTAAPTPSSSTPAAPTPAPAPGLRRHPRTAEHVAALLGVSAGDVVVCSTGLIGELLPMDKLLGGVDAAAAALTADGGDGRRGRHQDDRHRAQAGRRTPATAGPSAAWPRAPACSRPAWPRCSSSSPPTPSSTRPSSTPHCGPRPAVTFDRIDSDGCMSTNDTVLLMASGASGVRPDSGRVRRRR